MESNQESTSGFLWMKNEFDITSEKTSSPPAGSAITNSSSAHVNTGMMAKQFSTKKHQLFLVLPVSFCFTAVF